MQHIKQDITLRRFISVLQLDMIQIVFDFGTIGRIFDCQDFLHKLALGLTYGSYGIQPNLIVEPRQYLRQGDVCAVI